MMAALSLNAVRTVAPFMRMALCSWNAMRRGSIHQPWQPPWMTRPARKKPTSSGDFMETSFW